MICPDCGHDAHAGRCFKVVAIEAGAMRYCGCPTRHKEWASMVAALIPMSEEEYADATMRTEGARDTLRRGAGEDDDGTDRPVDAGQLSGAVAGRGAVEDMARREVALTVLGRRLETVAVTVLCRIAGIGQTLQAHAARLRRVQEQEER